MSVFDSLGQREPTAADGAYETKQAIAHAFTFVEDTLADVRRNVRRYGGTELRAALGSDAQEVENLYLTLKQVVEQNKPGAMVEDLPS